MQRIINSNLVLRTTTFIAARKTNSCSTNKKFMLHEIFLHATTIAKSPIYKQNNKNLTLIFSRRKEKLNRVL